MDLARQVGEQVRRVAAEPVRIAGAVPVAPHYAGAEVLVGEVKGPVSIACREGLVDVVDVIPAGARERHGTNWHG
jgi:hypothetical protein